MKVRQVIIIVSALVILFLGKLGMDLIGQPKERKTPKTVENVATVFVDTVKTGSIPVYLESTGTLEALNRMELFSEVQGVMQPDGGRFKSGSDFQKGATLISVSAADQRAQVVAQRSRYESLITSIMPDLRADFPKDYPTWQAFLTSLNVQSTIPSLPEVSSEKLKSFLTGRNIYSDYFSLKNTEIVLAKYQIRAPYNGVLVEANVDPGTVIRPGQALGVFIKPGIYEFQTSIDAVNAERLSIGQSVELFIEGVPNKSWSGAISRINRAVDQESQMSRFFVQVTSDDLKDGLFMQARIKANSIEDGYELLRSVIVGEDQVFIVESNLLVSKTVTPVHYNERTAIVKGLENGMVVLSQVPPGAFAGMKVSIYQEK